MHSFAHIADVHLGAHREPALQKLEQECFAEAMDECIQEGVDFVLVSGDLFHVGIPDLGVVNAALSKMMEVRAAGIPIYAIYGSHDYTPTGTSIIDILNTAGVLTNVARSEMVNGKLRLKVKVDEKSGAKLTGISARKVGLERKQYEVLDREALEREDGFKVFAFHSGITQFKPAFLSEMETVELTDFPTGFDYYAGGHIHSRGEYSAPGYERVVFPGPLFIGYSAKDMEEMARGEKRGFYIVRFDDKVRGVEFFPVETVGGMFQDQSVEGLNVAEANAKLATAFTKADVRGKLVSLRVRGTLAGGRASDLQLGGVRAMLMRDGAVHVYINRAGVVSKEPEKQAAAGEEPVVIEKKLFEAHSGRVKVAREDLGGRKGVATATELLGALRHGPKNEEQKKDYEGRMLKDGMATLRLEEGAA